MILEEFKRKQLSSTFNIFKSNESAESYIGARARSSRWHSRIWDSAWARAERSALVAARASLRADLMNIQIQVCLWQAATKTTMTSDICQNLSKSATSLTDVTGLGDGSSWNSPHTGARRQPLLPAPRWCFLVPQKRWPAESDAIRGCWQEIWIAKINYCHSLLTCLCLLCFGPALAPRAAPVQAHFGDLIFSMMIFRHFPPLDPLRLGFLLAGPGAPGGGVQNGHCMAPKKNPPASRARRSAYGRALVKISLDTILTAHGISCFINLYHHCSFFFRGTCRKSRQMHWPYLGTNPYCRPSNKQQKTGAFSLAKAASADRLWSSAWWTPFGILDVCDMWVS